MVKSWEETIVAIIILYMDDFKCKDIATYVRIGVQQVKIWTKKFWDGGDAIPQAALWSGKKDIKSYFQGYWNIIG